MRSHPIPSCLPLLLLIAPAATQDMQMPTPAPSLQKFQRLVGSWAGEGKMWQQPNGTPAPWTAKMVTGSILGGFFVHEQLEVEVGMPQPVRIVSYFGHDGSRDQDIALMLSSEGSGAVFDLEWVDDDTLIGVAAIDLGHMSVSRSSWKFADGGFSYRNERATANGEWFTHLEGQFKAADDVEVNGFGPGLSMAPVPPQMTAIAGMKGQYRVDGKIQMAGMPEPMTIGAHENIDPIWDGRMLHGHGVGDPIPGGGSWEGLSYFFWNQHADRYNVAMIDNMGAFSVGDGWLSGANRLVVTDRSSHGPTPQVNRTVIEFSDKGISKAWTDSLIGDAESMRAFDAKYQPAK